MKMAHGRAVLLVWMLGYGGVACTSDGVNGELPTEWMESASVSEKTLSYEEFRDLVEVKGSSPPSWIVHGHIAIAEEASLREYYQRFYAEPVEKSTGWLIGGQRQSRANAMSIRFCFSGGWGAQVGGTGGVTAPSLTSVETALLAGMRAWEGVAKVRFVYQSHLNGAGCTAANIAAGTLAADFVVAPQNQVCTASGPFPWFAAGSQTLQVPACGLPNFLAHHELGHVLGLRHEMEHPDSPCGLTGTNNTRLSDYDSSSVMMYQNCTGGADQNRISGLDGVGARVLYGPPNWWWSMLPSGL